MSPKLARIYTQPDCAWCTRAKKILEDNNYIIQEIVVGSTECTKEEFLRLHPKTRTVPQIYIDAKLVGGYNSLVAYFASI